MAQWLQHHIQTTIPSYAMTIHKSQGQTMTKAVIDIGDREMAAGCTFVALSRLKTLSGLLIQPMSFERLKSIGHLKRLQQRLKEEERLERLAANTSSTL